MIQKNLQGFINFYKKVVRHSPQLVDVNGVGLQVLLGYYLGLILGLGICFLIYSHRFYDLGTAMIFYSIFHLWEYLYVAIFRGIELCAHSFLIDHSREFGIALFTSLLEYFVISIFFPNFKSFSNIIMKSLFYFGLSMMIMGQIIRTLAMYTAADNFNHQIEIGDRRDDHKLVTDGIYGYFRHPAYFGWFWWSVGMQLTLRNPFSTVLWTGASWYFFKMRIPFEEEQLKKQFPQQYEEYSKKVPIGIPFI